MFWCQQLPDYLSHVDKRLSQENDRLLHYLHKTTRYTSHCLLCNFTHKFNIDKCLCCYTGYRKPLILCVEKQLVGEHQEEMLKKGTPAYIDHMNGHMIGHMTITWAWTQYMFLLCRFREFIRGKSLSWPLSALQAVHEIQGRTLANMQGLQWVYQGESFDGRYRVDWCKDFLLIFRNLGRPSWVIMREREQWCTIF